MFKRLITVFTLVLPVLLLAACSQKEVVPPAADDVNFEDNALTFVDHLVTSDYDSAVLDYSPEMEKALPIAKLKATWEDTIKDSGAFIAVEKTEKENKDGFQIITVYCAFENNGVSARVAYNESSEVAGLFFKYYIPSGIALDLPDDLEEKEIIVGENTRFPLKGKITSQKDVKSETAVILVHGSGPQDMDETIFMNKPFRDIAWELAAQGIDVLRYDKRTYSHGSSFTQEDLDTFTVEQETIEDAILAAKLLKEKGYQNIYLAGHSLGGMLSMRIEKDSGGIFSGIIVLAGSPRTLIDIIIDQNTNSIAMLTDEKQIEESNKLIDAEKDKLSVFHSWSETELKENTVFGLPGFYAKDLLSFDTAELAREISKPILILQGSEDFQVFADKDFILWKEALAGFDNAEFILYEGLNHLFMVSQGENKGTVDEYKIPSTVDKKVMDDIVSFIKKHSDQ